MAFNKPVKASEGGKFENEVRSASARAKRLVPESIKPHIPKGFEDRTAIFTDRKLINI